ncbi:MAG: TIGR02147 family protein [Fibrobacteria bacterium]|nr:TIGR02147 family protein [Fibrobacteria bacterium]
MDVFAYTEYRSFLRDFYENRKEANPIWSYRFMAQRLDVDAGQLVKILQGKLHLPQRALQATLKLCGLEGREAAFFEEMIRFSRARSAEESSRCYERMQALRGVSAGVVQSDQAEYYGAWHHTVIRALLGMAPFRGNWETLGSLCIPPLRPEEAKASVELLERLGIVVRDARDCLRLADTHITPGEGVPVETVRKFQKETLDLAKRALEEIAREEREISTITMALAESDLPLVQGWVKDLRRQIQTLSDSTPEPDRVYHLNVQLFPVARRSRRRGPA